MKKLLISLGLITSCSLFAQTGAPTATSAGSTPAPVSSSASAASAGTRAPAAASGAVTGSRAPITHGLDMRTQSGPAETMSSRGYSPPVPVNATLPTIWLIGDSTVRNGSPGNGSTNGPDGQWGWGAPLTFLFDPGKVNVVNRALGGTSSLSFYNANWKSMLALIKKGDVVIIQFGANGGELAGTGDEEQGGKHTFNWYLKEYITETREKGGTCILCSLTPRNKWTGDKLNEPNNHVEWTAQVAREMNVPYIDLHELIQRSYSAMGREKGQQMYHPAPNEGIHTGWAGAEVNAECVVSGLKALKNNPLTAFLSDKAKDIKPAAAELVADNAPTAKSTESATK